MRIDAYNAINQIQKPSKINKVSDSTVANAADKLEISQVGRDYQIATKAVKETPDIREDLVADIKSRISAGNYNVSDSDLADKILAGI